MARIYIGGAGGGPSNNFTRSLRESSRNDYLIGATCNPSDLFLADTDEKYVIPAALDKNYKHRLLFLLNRTKPGFMHVQNDYEVREVSRNRNEIAKLGVKLFLPSIETIETCVDKSKSHHVWQSSGVRVPNSIELRNPNDLKIAFSKLGEKIWIRANEGAAGRGALPTDNYEFAKNWIDNFNGWGEFTAAELLTEKTVTWQSIWHEGELVVAQGRKRISWNFGNRTLSGVTGITGVGVTCSDTAVDKVAQDAIFAIDSKPHGIFAVDMTYDQSGHPNPTEINIGRFFTTHYFFTKAGLNMPEIYCDIALEGKFPNMSNKLNPLPEGLVWIRGMDVDPALTTLKELTRLENEGE